MESPGLAEITGEDITSLTVVSRDEREFRAIFCR